MVDALEYFSFMTNELVPYSLRFFLGERGGEEGEEDEEDEDEE